MMDGSTGAAEEDDDEDANGSAGSVVGAELEAAVLLSAVDSTLIFFASRASLPEVASRTGLAEFFE